MRKTKTKKTFVLFHVGSLDIDDGTEAEKQRDKRHKTHKPTHILTRQKHITVNHSLTQSPIHSPTIHPTPFLKCRDFSWHPNHLCVQRAAGLFLSLSSKSSQITLRNDDDNDGRGNEPCSLKTLKLPFLHLRFQILNIVGRIKNSSRTVFRSNLETCRNSRKLPFLVEQSIS